MSDAGGGLYFAYGSNMSSRQMAERCPGATVAGIARLPGYRLAFDRYSVAREGFVADVVPDAGSDVWGVCWHVSGEHLASLDRFEGVARAAYQRATVAVLIGDQSLETVVYRVVSPEPEGPPSAAYLRIILEGAEEHALPPAYIDHLRSFAPPNPAR